MILFNWSKIFSEAQGNPKEVFNIIKYLSEGTIPRNKYDKVYRYYTKNFAGESFLINPDVLIYNAYKHSYRDIGIYIAFASLRSIGDYFATQTTTLDVRLVDLQLLQHLDNNSLLYMDEDTKIHFLYEEAPKEKH